MIIAPIKARKREFDEKQKEVYRETNKLITEFRGNRLVRDFTHYCNKRVSEILFNPKISNPYIINECGYTTKDIKEFIFVFLAKFPFHLYKEYDVFRSENGYFKLSFKIGNNNQLINFTIKDETTEEDN